MKMTEKNKQNENEQGIKEKLTMKQNRSWNE